jgi:hypothetical protein
MAAAARRIFVLTTSEERLSWGGPERERSSADNQYVLRWVGIEDLTDLDLRPAGIAPLIRELLTSDRNLY